MLIHMCKYVDRNGFATMLATNRSAGVTPEVHLTNPSCAGDEAHKCLLSNPGQTSSEVQNRGISGYMKRTNILQN